MKKTLISLTMLVISAALSFGAVSEIPRGYERPASADEFDKLIYGKQNLVIVASIAL